MPARANLLAENDADFRTWLPSMTVSAVCHVVLFAVLVFAPDLTPRHKYTPSVIDVELVSLPEKGAASDSAKQAAAKMQKQPSKPERTEKLKPKVTQPEKTPLPEPPPKSEPEVAQKPPETVSVAPKKQPVKETPPKSEIKEVKTSLKKKTYKSAKVVKRAIEQIEKESPGTRPKTVSEAIDRLKTSVGDAGPASEAIARLKRKVGEEKSGQDSGGAPGGDGGRQTLELIDLYRVEIAFDINKNWAFSEQLAGGQRGLVVELAFKVMPNGEITEIWFDKRSGNSYLDESAYSAVKKTNPVRPHPPGLFVPFVEVGLRFGPGGVQ